MEKTKTTFETLASVDVNEHLDKKETGKDRFGKPITLSYLSWAWAWDYFKREMPDATYVIRHWGDKPYLYDETLGFMVETSITAGGETYTMWLPVMDGTNSAMKAQQQSIIMKKKDGTTYTRTIPAATMFDINKTIMRCLVKNMAMFGLGLYIYAGEDLPNDTDETVTTSKPQTINDVVGDEIPAMFPGATIVPTPARTAAHPDDWMTPAAFGGVAAKINSVPELQDLLNAQRGNPNIKKLVEIASARKAEIIATMGA